MANRYATDALAKARKDGLTADAVSALDYRGIAAAKLAADTEIANEKTAQDATFAAKETKTIK